jgi:hypothetical protein
MIGNPTVCGDDPAIAFYFLPKSVGEAFVVKVVGKQFFAGHHRE